MRQRKQLAAPEGGKEGDHRLVLGDVWYHDKDRWRFIGNINRRRWHKRLTSPAHQQHNLRQAWAIQLVCWNAYENQVDHVVIYDKTEKKYYATHRETFNQHAIQTRFGHGTQLFLPLEHWVESTVPFTSATLPGP